MTRPHAKSLGNLLTIADRLAMVTYDPDIDMLRGEFMDLNGSADFYASDIATLKAEGAKSLAAFLDVCRENGIEPCRPFSGEVNTRTDLGRVKPRA